MLSKISILVLGIIKEKPLNAYEVTKLLKAIKVNYWLPAAESTIYVTMKKLNQKGYLSGSEVKEGNMPGKVVYTITPGGKNAFEKSLIGCLSDTSLDLQLFNIGNIFMCHLSRDRVFEIWGRKVKIHEKVVQELKARLDELTKGGEISIPALTVISHNINLIEAELKTINRLMVEIKKDNNWDYFLTSGLNEGTT